MAGAAAVVHATGEPANISRLIDRVGSNTGAVPQSGYVTDFVLALDKYPLPAYKASYEAITEIVVNPGQESVALKEGGAAVSAVTIVLSDTLHDHRSMSVSPDAGGGVCITRDIVRC